MRRFFVPPGAVDGEHAILEGALAHRLATVLRLREGDSVGLFDGSGVDTILTLRDVKARRVTGTVTGVVPSPAEPRTRVHLYQSITKGERFEWLVEKATEVGVTDITPLITARAVVRTKTDAARLDRWRRIAVEAAEQCERGTVPEVHPPVAFATSVETAVGVLLIPYEEARAEAPTIDDSLRAHIDELYASGTVSIFIGPEGGFERAEVDQARAAGATVITLGERVLRSETAGLVALVLVLQACGELG